MSFLLFPIGILVLYTLTRSFFGIRSKPGVKREMSGAIFASVEDGFFQVYLFLATMFLGLFLINLNRSFGYPIGNEYLRLVLTLICFIQAYTLRAYLLLPFSILGTISTVFAFVDTWTINGQVSDIGWNVALLLVVTLLYGIGRLHQISPLYRRYAYTYIFSSLALITGYLFYFSSHAGLQTLQTALRGPLLLGSLPLSIFLLILTGVTAFVFVIGAVKKVTSWYEVFGGAFLILVALSIPFFPHNLLTVAPTDYSLDFSGPYNTQDTLTSSGLILLVLSNALLVVYLSGWLILGYFKKERWAINIGSFLFVVFFIYKYFDFFFGSLSKSLLFIVSGIFLLVLGLALSYGRKTLLAHIQN